MPRLLHPSGGLRYHFAAFRHRRLWVPFHDRVRDWLTAWQPASRRLVLVGPSGGYALDPAFLARFDDIVALEPDPLARFILARRRPGIRFEDDAGFVEPDGFFRLVECHAGAAFLFCNLLGQTLVGQSPDPEARRVWLDSLPAALAGQPWASWHDLASTTRAPDHWPELALAGALELDALLARFWRGGELIIHDHDCAGLCPERPRDYAIWAIRPGQWHLIEWLAGAPAGGRT